MNFDKNEIELLKKAISFLMANLAEAEESLDISISFCDLEEIEKKFFFRGVEDLFLFSFLSQILKSELSISKLIL